MKMIVLSEKDFDAIFRRVEADYQYDHEFMKAEERPATFKETLRHHHLMKFRSSIKSLKDRISAA